MVNEGGSRVLLDSHLDAGNILEPDDVSVSVAAEDDVPELLRRVETRLSDDGEVVLLRLD